MGWGSGFDGWSTQIHLCKECISNTDSRWWDLKVVCGETEQHGSAYEFEDDIFSFIDALPIAGQELFYNRYSSGWNSYGYWEPQDYIDYRLNILPHEKCKEYSVYSPEEINAYRTRFPACQHPVNVIYHDNSSGCRCVFGAFGNKGQLADEGNVRSECYRCVNFKERETEIKTISDKDYSDFKTFYTYKLKEEEYREKFES